MNRVKAAGSVIFASRDTAPVGGTPQYFTVGNPQTSVPATVVPGYFLNMTQDEICAVITAAGITLDDTDWTQLLKALRTLFTYGKQTVNTYGSSTTFVVPATVFGIFMEGWGGGGGGGSGNNTTQGGYGGGGGQYGARFSSVTPGETLTITIGAGGVGNAVAGNAGTTGGNTSVSGSVSGALITVIGGQGGPTSTSPQAAAGGTGGSGWQYEIDGQGSFVQGAGGSGTTNGSVGGGSPNGGYGGQPGNTGGVPGGGGCGNTSVNTYGGVALSGAHGQVRLTFVQ